MLTTKSNALEKLLITHCFFPQYMCSPLMLNNLKHFTLSLIISFCLKYFVRKPLMRKVSKAALYSKMANNFEHNHLLPLNQINIKPLKILSLSFIINAVIPLAYPT